MCVWFEGEVRAFQLFSMSIIQSVVMKTNVGHAHPSSSVHSDLVTCILSTLLHTRGYSSVHSCTLVDTLQYTLAHSWILSVHSFWILFHTPSCTFF